MKGIMGVCVLLAALATPAMAVVIQWNNWNGTDYHDGVLAGQTDPIGSTWAGPAPNIIVTNAATNGSVRAAGDGSHVWDVGLTLPTAIDPGPDGKIIVSVDLTNLVGSGGNAMKLCISDTAGNEMSRTEVQGGGCRGRGPGGVSIVTPVMTVILNQTRQWWIVIDTAGVGGNAWYYHDSIAPENLMGATNPIPYTTLGDSVGNIRLETVQNANISCNVDNLSITPEPVTLVLLGLGGLLGLRRRRA